MSNDGGGNMTRRCCTSPALGPLDDHNLLAEILLRLPPMPSSLPRASLVCNRWRSVATDAAFRRHFRTHHRKPPILGAFLQCCTELKFMPLFDPPDRIPSGLFSLNLHADGGFAWNVLGCRHGRVLLINRSRHLLLVFEPVSGDTLCILIPPEFVRDGYTNANAAVLCAAGDDHVHGDCHTSPFKVVVVDIVRDADVAIARVYSHATGMWGDLVSLAQPFAGRVTFHRSSTLSGLLLKGTMDAGAEDGILKFNLDSQRLTVISRPHAGPVHSQIQIIRAEDGGLGLAILSYPSFQLWDHMVNCHGVSTWVLRKTVNMDNVLGSDAEYTHMVGYAEGADAIFMSMFKKLGSLLFRHVMILQLESMMVKECRGNIFANNYYPLTNFYTAGN